jgi:hypothetical protein
MVTKACPKCDTNVPADMEFCTSCGNHFGRSRPDSWPTELDSWPTEVAPPADPVLPIQWPDRNDAPTRPRTLWLVGLFLALITAIVLLGVLTPKVVLLVSSRWRVETALNPPAQLKGYAMTNSSDTSGYFPGAISTKHFEYTEVRTGQRAEYHVGVFSSSVEAWACYRGVAKITDEMNDEMNSLNRDGPSDETLIMPDASMVVTLSENANRPIVRVFRGSRENVITFMREVKDSTGFPF